MKKVTLFAASILASTLLIVPASQVAATVYKGTVSYGSTTTKLDSVKVKVKYAKNAACSTTTNSQGVFRLSFTTGIMLSRQDVAAERFSLNYNSLSRGISWDGNHNVALTLYNAQGSVVAKSNLLKGQKSFALPRLADGMYVLKATVDGAVFSGKILTTGNSVVDVVSGAVTGKALAKSLAAVDTLVFSKAQHVTKQQAVTGVAATDSTMTVSLTIPGTQLLAPNGGAGVAYKIGDTIKIKYRANPDSVTKVYLEVMFGAASYTLSPCDTCDDLTGFTNGGGLPVTFNWKIPDSVFNSFYGEMRPTPTSTNCKVKVEDYYLRYVDQSDSSFAINPR